MKGKSRKSTLPPIGSLIKLRPYSSKLDHVKVEALQFNDEGDVRNFDTGVVAVVTHHVKNGESKQKVPVILVQGFQGWIFKDEWEPLETQNEMEG